VKVSVKFASRANGSNVSLFYKNNDIREGHEVHKGMEKDDKALFREFFVIFVG
jgi:hypothetical protein